MDGFVKLDGPPIEEGSCFLRSYGLQKTRELDTDVVIFHYAVEPHRRFQGKAPARGPVQRDSTSEPSEEEDLIHEPDAREEQSAEYLILGDRQSLYKTKVGRKAVINPVYFPNKVTQSLLVIDFVGCDIETAKSFINAAVSASPESPTSRAPSATSSLRDHGPSTVFDAESLETPFHFITGISLRAATGPTEFLTLFVSIPYLGVGSNPTLDGSRTLSQYRLNDDPATGLPEVDEKPKALREDQVLVHQIWFLVFNNETIGIFRSENDKYRNRAPLFSYQKRGGAFAALVNMIANTLTSSEKEALKILRRQIVKLESSEEPESYEDLTESETKEELTEGETKEKRPGKERQFGDFITHVFTIMRLVRSQIEYLENLLHIFQTSYGRKMKPRPQWNEYEIPFVHGHNEQMHSTVAGIKALIDEREKFYRELRIWVEELGHSRSLFLQGNQAKSQESIISSLSKQGQTISVFTLITSVFLPLGFLSSYYGMNPPKFTSVTITTTREFWLVSAPITSVLFLIMSVFLFNQDDGIKNWLRRWFDQSNGIRGWLQRNFGSKNKLK